MRAQMALILLLPLLVSCGRIRELRGCRALAQRINPALDEIADSLAKKQGAIAYRKASARYRALSSELKDFDIGVSRLRQPVIDLATAMNEAGVQTKNLAEALEAKDTHAGGSARRELAQLARLEKAIIGQIEAGCQGE